jgi:hypothetical protein
MSDSQTCTILELHGGLGETDCPECLIQRSEVAQEFISFKYPIDADTQKKVTY